MTVNRRWYSQNRIHQMKERKQKLERFIQTTKKEIETINNLKLFEKDPDQGVIHYIFDIIFLFLLRLDMIVGFYINRFQMNRIVKKAQKEIRGLTLSIRIETKMLNESEKYE